MTITRSIDRALLLLVTGALAACAGTGDLVSAPAVSLNNVEIAELDFSRQVFVLGFDVSNPNPFPLPVTRVRYGVELDGQRFASGETAGGFTIPARGDAGFAISVELDLLKSAPQLLYTVRDAARRDIPYALEGSLGVDIPFARPVDFASTGEIRLRTR